MMEGPVMVIATVDCFCSFALFCFLFVLVCFVENYILFAGEDEPWSVFELTLLLFVENVVSSTLSFWSLEA